jgi:phage terminase large subunit
VLAGAYYAKAIAKAKAEGRIGHKVARDPLMAIRAFWDIGSTGKKADACAIWIGQFIGTQIRFLDYYEAVGQELSVHVAWMRDNKYDKALCFLPHDGVKSDTVYDVSYKSALEGAGFDVEVIENQGSGAAMARKDAVLRLFPNMHFDVKCQPGLDALGWYHEKKDETRNIGLGPEHDWSSHGADAHGLSAVVYETPRGKKDEDEFPQHYGAQGWMGN